MCRDALEYFHEPFHWVDVVEFASSNLQYSCRTLFGSKSAVSVPAGPIVRCSCVGTTMRGAENTSLGYPYGEVHGKAGLALVCVVRL